MLYDDSCGPCTGFAKAASDLSRGWIRTAGHSSEEAAKAKAAVFPQEYDPTKMFWIINKGGAFGARSGLLPLAKEVMFGWFKGGDNDDQFLASRSPACSVPSNTLRRLTRMLSHGATFKF